MSGPAGEPAGADLLDPCGRRPQSLARDRRVGRDDPVQTDRERQVGDAEHVVVGEVGCDLHQQRNPAGDRLHRGQDGFELLHRLEVAQPRRVRRADVDDQVVGVRRQQPGGLLVVAHRLVLGDELGLADVHAEHRPPRIRAGRRPRASNLAATASAPSLLKPIRFTTARSSGSRNSRGARVAGLRLAGDRADLDVAEPERAEAVDADRVLVEAGGQAEHVGERQPERRHRLPRRTSPAGDRSRCPDRPEGRVVRLLGVGPGEDVVEQRPVDQRLAQSCSDRTPISPRRIASMPCTAAPSPWTVVMHGMLAITEAVRIS